LTESAFWHDVILSPAALCCRPPAAR